MKKSLLVIPLLLICLIGITQSKLKKLPVIDMHVHALRANDQGPAPLTIGVPFDQFGSHDPKQDYDMTFMQAMKMGTWAKQITNSPLTDDSLRILTLKALRDNNVYAVTSGEIELVRKWKSEEPKRIINAVYWDFSSIKRFGLTIDSMSKLFKTGEFKVFGEVGIQYEGYSPSDTAFEPYLQMAEALDIPVGIHVGPGPPGVIYLGANKYRASLHSALVLEEALVKHPKLRIYAMHAGWPMIDDLIATLYAHPQLYIDLGIISYDTPIKEYYYYLERIINAGFCNRIMFGSDNMVWPGTIQIAIDRIQKAPFLTESQKRDILFNNAARFLRLTPEQIKTMN